eukprot:gene25331-33864_t
MQSFTNFINIDLGFPSISAVHSNSRRDNSIKIIEADCRACLQYYQQKQADRQKQLLLSNRKRAMNQWKKLQGDRILAEDSFLDSEDNKDQHYYHNLINESMIKRRVDCIFPGAEVLFLTAYECRTHKVIANQKLPVSEYDGDTFNLSFPGKRTQSIKTDNGPKYKFRNCSDENDECCDMDEILESVVSKQLQNSLCEKDCKSFFSLLHSWNETKNFNLEQIPFSIAEDKGLQQEFFARLFCEASVPSTAGALEAMNTALPPFSHPRMTSAPPPDGLSAIRNIHSSNSAAAAAAAAASSSSTSSTANGRSSSNSNSRAPTMSQTLHIPDFSALSLPVSNTWIPVLRNTWTKDDKVLRVIPYLGEEKDDNDDEEAKVDLSCCKRRAVTVCGEAEESTVMFIMDKYGIGLGHASDPSSSSSSISAAAVSSSDSSPVHDGGIVDQNSDVYQALSNVLGISCKELFELYSRLEESGRKRAFSLKKSGKAVDYYQYAVDFDLVNRDSNLHRLLQASTETTANEIAESKLDSGLGIFLGNNRNVDSLSDENYRYFFCR